LVLHTCVDAQAKPSQLTFSYVDHPVVTNDLIPIVERAYSELGIQLELLMYPTHRNLTAVQSEEVDGDIAFSELGIIGYDELVKIEPSLGSVNFVLLCIPGVVCNEEVLFNENNVIVVSDKLLSSLQIFYSRPLKSSFYKLNNLSTISSLVVKNRFQYGVYILGGAQALIPEMQRLKVVDLFEVQTHHTIHQKFAFMQDDISAALQRSLDNAKK
jgi:hypothetical protein